MHASLWRFAGDPDELLCRYEAMVAEIPSANMRLHLCLSAPDGIVLVDTCPSEEIFQAFSSGPFPALRAKHGLPDPERLEDFPVHAAFVDGQRTVEEALR
jgi:hypothetical protein